jgi:hypothetical protein
MRWSVLDGVIQAATRDNADLIAARDEWSALIGPVYPDHELYAERSDAFVEWYVLERCGPDGLTPVERLLRQEGAIAEADRPTAEALCRSYRSLFQVRELREGLVVIDDLLGGGCFEVDERRRLPGVIAGDVFEGRIVPDADQPYRLHFTRTSLFHPREARRAVLSHAEQARCSGQPRAAVLARLQRLKLRCTSYKHVPAHRIYAQADAP